VEREDEKTPYEITSLKAEKKVGGKTSVPVTETDLTV
jgi:hypothetical protein